MPRSAGVDHRLPASAGEAAPEIATGQCQSAAAQSVTTGARSRLDVGGAPGRLGGAGRDLRRRISSANAGSASPWRVPSIVSHLSWRADEAGAGVSPTMLGSRGRSRLEAPTTATRPQAGAASPALSPVRHPRLPGVPRRGHVSPGVSPSRSASIPRPPRRPPGIGQPSWRPSPRRRRRLRPWARRAGRRDDTVCRPAV
jgi:hypothetical protein